jgi:hypothetical protein
MPRSLIPVMTPHGSLRLDKANDDFVLESGLADRLEKGFERGSGHGRCLRNGALFKGLGVAPTALDRVAQTRRIQRWRPPDGQNSRPRAHRWLARGEERLRREGWPRAQAQASTRDHVLFGLSFRRKQGRASQPAGAFMRRYCRNVLLSATCLGTESGLSKSNGLSNC